MSAFIDYTYHSHTARCGHARGADEDYAKTAFEHGYKLYGFSDHEFINRLNPQYNSTNPS